MPKPRRNKKIINHQPSLSRQGHEGLSIINNSKEIGRRPMSKSRKVVVKNLSRRENKGNKDEILAQESTMNEPQFNTQAEEQKNRLIMWAGISCLMVLFVIIWIFNLKYEFNRVGAGKSAGFGWTQARAELDKTMKQVKQSLAEIKQLGQTGKNILSKQAGLTPEQLNLLKGKLLNEIATGTASSTKGN